MSGDGRPFDEEALEHEILPTDLEINELRGRLDRRNALLDVIRKAYHRDVLVIKECLLDAQRQNNLSPLATLPSIDLRETFRLFAPQECELRVRPCWSCGGQLEVIHRESARIVDFKHAILQLGQREHKLRLELVDTKVKASEDRDRLVDLMQKSADERDVLLEQILSLKHQVADRNALEVEVRQLKADKHDLECALEDQKPILLDHKQLVVEIEKVKNGSRQWEAKYHKQVENNRLLQSEKDALSQELYLCEQTNNRLQEDLDEAREQCSQLDAQCSTLTQDLSKSQATVEETEACLKKAENAINELETDFQQKELQLEERISELQDECLDLQSTISELKDTSEQNAKEAQYYRVRIETTLEGDRRNGSIAIVPEESDEDDAKYAKINVLISEYETLRSETDMLSNLLRGCIRSTYENCLVQEKLLTDNNAELYRKSHQQLDTSSEPANDKACMVLDHLNNSAQSDVIDWMSILENETDQRHIMGNLQNRLQIGQFSLDKAFAKIHNLHALEMRKVQDEHNKEIEKRRLRIWELEKSKWEISLLFFVHQDAQKNLHSFSHLILTVLTEAIGLNRRYEDKMIKLRDTCNVVESEIESLRTILRKMRRECQKNEDVTSKLKDDYVRMRTVVCRLLDHIKSSKQEIEAQKVDIADKQVDVENRDKAISQLEALLGSITHKYAENERRRIKITHDIAIQSAPKMIDSTTHVDFLLPTPLGGLAAERQNRRLDDLTLIPGRLYKTPIEENWPSRIKSGLGFLQYRRAVDKL